MTPFRAPRGGGWLRALLGGKHDRIMRPGEAAAINDNAACARTSAASKRRVRERECPSRCVWEPPPRGAQPG
eukprot:scaffold6968_cov117-Isochrysis_galbana.AAC.5